MGKRHNTASLCELAVVIGPDVSKRENNFFEPCILGVVTRSQMLSRVNSGTILDISFDLQNELITNMKSFQFPDGCPVFKTPTANKIMYDVLTNELAFRYYIVIVEVPIVCTGNEIEMIVERNIDNDECNAYFSTIKLCLISLHRQFEVMKSLIQGLITRITKFVVLKPEVHALITLTSGVTVPPVGNVVVEFEYNTNLYRVLPPLLHGHDHVPWALPFYYFNHTTIVQIITAIICEEQIVFVSRDPAIRTLIIEVFLAAIYPLKWNAPYIPNLTIYDMLGAIGFFIFGAGREICEYLVDYKNIVVVDIDYGTIAPKNTKYEKNLEMPTNNFMDNLPHSFLFDYCRYFVRTELPSHRNSRYTLQIFVSFQKLLLDLFKDLLRFSDTNKKASVKKKFSIELDCASE